MEESLPNWLVLSKGGDRLSVFVTERRRGSGSKVLHMLRPAPED